jgi:hypothetical protein
MKGIEHNNANIQVDKNSKIIRYGKSRSEEVGGVKTTKPITSIDERTFYQIYLELQNVIKWRQTPNGNIDMSLSDTPIELLAHMMTKDENFTLLYRNKDKSQIQLGIELGEVAGGKVRTPQSVYTSIAKLRKAEYIVKTEDNLFVPCDELRQLMKKVKSEIKEKGFVTFDFLFKFCVR